MAAAQSGGGGGGAEYVAKPAITKVSCVRRCASRHRAQGGSTIRISGHDLDGVVKVVFRGSYGRGDDTSTPVRPRGLRAGERQGPHRRRDRSDRRIHPHRALA